MSLLRVVKPGMLTTVQDLGRWGRQGLGVPVAGPMDLYSHQLANSLVGNDPTAAALEITLIGPELEADDDVTCAVSGAAFAMLCGDAAAPMNEPFILPAGRRLRFGARGAGARATLAVRGGLLVPPLFGSRATSVVARLGGLDGRALKAGDELRVGGPAGTASPRHAPVHPSAHRGAGASLVPALPMPAGGARLRVIRGPQAKMFTAAAYDALFASRYTITSNSNRMGYRLEGAALAHAGARGHPLRCDADWLHPGAGGGAADSAHGRPSDDRGLSEDCDRDQCRSAARRPARAGRLDRVQRVHAGAGR